jgi:hypothetical protein
MTDIERRIRIEQEWARRNVMAEHLNSQRYEAYNWRRGLREPSWELGDLSWSVPHWREPTREFEFKLDWESLSTSSHRSPQRRMDSRYRHSSLLAVSSPAFAENRALRPQPLARRLSPPWAGLPERNGYQG